MYIPLNLSRRISTLQPDADILSAQNASERILLVLGSRYLDQDRTTYFYHDFSGEFVEDNAIRERYLSSPDIDFEDLSDVDRHETIHCSRPQFGPHNVWSDDVQVPNRGGCPRYQFHELAEAVSAFDPRDLDEDGQPVVPKEKLPPYASSSGLMSYYDATGLAHELDFARFNAALRSRQRALQWIQFSAIDTFR